jgi:filamentous hemagglutinin family protein
MRTLMLGVALHMFSGVAPHAYAQVTTAITPDGTLGTAAVRSGNVIDINGGTVKGTNQFHSFQQFSVGTGEIASFNGAATIKNILSRVTGATRSEIDGTLRSTIPGANLFLLNPRGILFGPNAQLDLSGAFHATTADYIRLADGTRFNAVPSAADNLLTTAPPDAFGFLTSNPASIDVQAGVFDFNTGFTTVLQAPTGGTLSFVGGPIHIGAAPGAFVGGLVLAPGGRLNVVSVASPGEAKFDGTIFSVDTFAKLGDITINGNSVLDAKEVFIRGGRLVIEQANILPGFFFLSGFPVDPPNGGEVNIQVSDSVIIKGPPSDLNGFSGILTFAGEQLIPGDVPHIRIKSSSVSLSEGALIQTVRQGPGNPSDVLIEADTVDIRNGASIAALNFYEGSGGTLTVNAKDVTLDSAGAPSDQFTGFSAQAFFHPLYAQPTDPLTGSFAGAFLPAFQLAESGSITVNATGTLTMRGNAQISTDNFAFGRSGSVTVNAADMLLVGAGANTGLIAAQSRLAGRAGDVTINATGSIDMQNGFRISANTLGSDDAGQVNVHAGKSLTLTGASTFISSVTDQPVDVALDSFAQVFDTFFQLTRGIATPDYPSLRTALGVAAGTGDLMQVLASLSTLSDGAGTPVVAITDFTPGAGGRVSITTPVLAANDGAHIETSTLWDGNAGAIELNVGALTVRDGAIIGSRSGAVRVDRGFTVGTGNAGTISIAATDTVDIAGRSLTTGDLSTVSTSTAGAGQGGDVSISAGKLVSIADGGLVRADTLTGTGAAGRITITSGDQILMASGGRVDSSTSGAGAGGDVTMVANQVLVNGLDSGMFSTASSSGNAGRITVSTPSLSLTDGAKITVETSGSGNAGDVTLNVNTFSLASGSRIDSSTSGAGRGGTISFNAPTGTLTINGAGMFSDATASGPGGDINLGAERVSLTGATISATSTGTATATAGNINVAFGSLLDMVNSNITTNALLADGGNITIFATGSLLHLIDSAVTTSVQSGVGSGGNITLGSQGNPLTHIVLDGSAIRADAFGGPGGNISIFADIFLTQNSLLSASSALAAPGTIAVQAQVTDVSGTLAQLPESILQAAALLRASCMSRLAEGKASSLVVAGREGVPPTPDGWLWSPISDIGGPAFSLSADAPNAEPLRPYFTVTLRSRCAG